MPQQAPSPSPSNRRRNRAGGRAARHAILMAEPDRGQSHGITKGFARATGDVMTWLNSDDFYPAPDVLAKVAAAFRRHPEADVIYGGVNFVDESGAFRENRDRWLYTGLTRAANRITVVR